MLVTDPARSCFRKSGVVGGDPREAMLKISPWIIITTCPYCCLVWLIAQRTVKKKLCSHIHLLPKNVVRENGEWQLSNRDCTNERNCGFHIWYANCIKLTMQYERPNGSSLTSSFTRKLRNIAFHCPLTNAEEKWSLCHWMLKNMYYVKGSKITNKPWLELL